MPSPGVSVAASTMFARSSGRRRGAPRRPAACVTPAGSCSEMTALEDDVRRLGEHLRRDDREHDADGAEQRGERERPLPRGEEAEHAAEAGAEVLRLAGLRRCPSRRSCSRACSASSCSMRSSSVIGFGSAPGGRGRGRSSWCRCSCRGLHSELGFDDLAVRLDVSRSSSCVPMPTMPPSSSTMMRSASVMVETRWATTIFVTSGNSRHNACLQSRVGGEVERRERVVEHEDVGVVHDRPGDGEPLALAARHVGAALCDAAVQPALHLGHEVAALGDLECVPELGVGGILATESQVGCHGAGEEERTLRHEADGLPQAGRGRPRARRRR